MISLFQNAARIVVTLAVVGLLATASSAGDLTQQPNATLIKYKAPDGESYFALGLKMAESDVAAQPCDHVILVDTSASQVGHFRKTSLAVLKSFLESVNPDDRVNLFAVDVEAKNLSGGFHAPDAQKIAAALRKLEARIPLGATDLEAALKKATEGADSKRRTSVLYIGDGMSTAKLVGNRTMRKLLADLHERHIAVHSFVVGPQTDLRLLGVVAEHTGGVVMIEDAKRRDSALYPQEVGENLAKAAVAPVYYPSQLKIEPAAEQLYPESLPPLRADRETILIGKGDPTAAARIVAQLTTGDDVRSISWRADEAAQQAGNTFLAALFSHAEADNGLSVPLAGTELLNLTREAHEQFVDRLVDEGHRAVAAGKLKEAGRIVDELGRIDPANVQAKVIFATGQKAKTFQVALQEQPPTEEKRADDAEKAQDLIEQQNQRRIVKSQQLKQEVSAVLEEVRKIAEIDPEAAIVVLKQQLQAVTGATDIYADVREQLRRRVTRALESMEVIREKRELARIEAGKRESEGVARRRIADQLRDDEERLAEMIAQVSASMAEGFSAIASTGGDVEAFEKAEAVARRAFEINPYSGVTASAVFKTEAAGQLDKAKRMVALRGDMFLATLYQVERSHVPFPDEPPVVYPPADVWFQLTEHRKARWSSVDLKKFSPAEDKIRRALELPTEIEFPELPLTECLTFLQDFHEINILIDTLALDDEGISPESPVTLALAGVSLRSVLKLMLEPLQLTYIIEDDVMKITTAVAAEDILSTRVYPVADLVIPIQNLSSGGGGGGFGGGGQGGFGGGFGGGGGQGGFGGGGGGGGFGGGGGGFGGGGFGGGFNVPVEDVPQKATPDSKKKR